MSSTKTNSLNPLSNGPGKDKANAINNSDSVSGNTPKFDELKKAIDTEMSRSTANFPIQIFPDCLQRLIENARVTKCFNPDYFSAGILSACAAAIGNSAKLDNGSFCVKSILWLIIVGSRGTGKSHPLSWALKPLLNKDSEGYKQYQDLYREWSSLESNNNTKPYYSKLVLTDFTTEKLAQALQHNEKGVLIYADELMGWLNSFGRYTKNPDQQIYLMLWNGGELSVDRKSSEPIRIDETNVNIIGGIQPEILKNLAQNNRSEDGFLDRFLTFYPGDTEPILFTGKNIEERWKQDYDRLINNLFDLKNLCIKASPSNIQIYSDWQHKAVQQFKDDTLDRAIQAKLETYVWRLALVLEVIHQASKNEFKASLRDQSLKDAIELAEYFRDNSFKVHDKIISNNPVDDLTEQRRLLYEELPLEFKRADVLSLFEKYEVKGGTISRFLNNPKLFARHKYGHYKKR